MPATCSPTWARSGTRPRPPARPAPPPTAALRRARGYVGWGTLAAVVTGPTLFGLGAWVVVEAVGRIARPHPIQTSLFVVVAVLGIVVNAIGLWVLHGH